MERQDELNLTAKAWIALGIGPQRETPGLHRLAKPLGEARLGLVTTGGFVPPGAEPFKVGKLGDPTFREIPAGIDPGRLEIHHPHYNHAAARQDINVLFPLPLCQQLVDEGVVGCLARTHYSFMGYIPVTRRLEKTYAPELARRFEREQVDAVLLVPA